MSNQEMADTVADGGAIRRRRLLSAMLRDVGPFGVVILLGVVLTFLSPYFLRSGNIEAIFLQMSTIAIIAVGQTMVIITAGIDLSVSTIVALAGVVSTTLMVYNHFGVIAGILAGMAVGAIAGLANGLLITRLHLPPFIATLGMLSVCEGVALLIPNGQAVYGVPQSFHFLGGGYLGPIPMAAIVMVVVAVIGYVVLAHTTLGRAAYAIGGNAETARLSGINVTRSLIYVYMISGLLAGLAGVMEASRVVSGQPDAGNNYNLNSIAAAVIGGASLFGGEGTVLGALIGALLMEIISNGSDLLNISTFWQDVVIGVVIVLAVFYDNIRRRALARQSSAR
jgi:ribose transport system permease protein